MKHALASISLILTVAACSELPELEPGTCGNFVLDPGEDCDEDSALCVGCRLACAPEPAEPLAEGEVHDPCPVEGYTCGVDSVCHAPSGVFAPSQGTSEFRGRQLAITNIDRDGVGDVVGVGDNLITVSYGDPSGVPTGGYELLTPFVRGLPAFAPLDKGDSLDVLIPTADGIAGYTSPDGVDFVTAHSFAFSLAPENSCDDKRRLGAPFYVFSLTEKYLGVIAAKNGVPHLAVVRVADQSSCSIRDTVPLCDTPVPPNAFPNTPPLDIYKSSTATVIAMRLGGALCAVSLPPDPTAVTYTATEITPPGAIFGRPVLANLGGGGCPALVLPGAAIDDKPRMWPAKATVGACAFDSRTDLPVEAPAGARPVGRLTLEPPIALAAPDAIVFDTGVYAVGVAPEISELYRSDRAIELVQQGDFDRDGDIDGVVSASLKPNEQDDIDVLVRTSSGPFLRRRIDTAAPVAVLQVGDYDGDEIDDIAFTERTDEDERLQVVFGTRDLPLPPVALGTFGYVGGMCPVQVRDSADPTEIVQDLVVFDLGENPSGIDNATVTVLHGSPQRTLQSFIDPRSQFDTLFVGLIVGTMFANTSIDVLAFELAPPVTGGINPVPPPARLWPFEGIDFGRLESGTAMMSKLASCAVGEAALCAESARFTMWTGDRPFAIGFDDGRDANDAPRHFAVFDVGALEAGMNAQTYGTADPLFATAPAVPRNAGITNLATVQLDEAGPSHVAIAFGGVTPTAPIGDVRLCTLDPATGMPSACPSITTLVPSLAGATCVDAVEADLASRGRTTPVRTRARDLLVLCYAAPASADRAMLYRVWRDDASTLQAALVSELRGAQAYRVRVGDVTGDKLDDLVVLGRGGASSFLHVMRQCGASDLACQGSAQ